ncbi:hypothetical protein [Paenibacillus wenxiniae]|uniref:Uncharacterized protein n=1 Tax=Paenibacillus wenxiniae TaxID=1636843 RepID=A0ABW4RP12_9BACL
MKTRNIAILSTLSLALALTAAPTSFASSVSPDVTVNNPLVSAPNAISVNAISYPVGSERIVLTLRGELAVTVTPARYATFNLQLKDLKGNIVANQAYSGSSPYTFRISNNAILGDYYLTVTSSTGGSNGSFTVSYL